MTDKPEPPARMSGAGWLAIAVLVIFLVLSLWYAVWAWGRMEGVNISTAGWIFLGLGVVMTIAVGGGLMGLVFYSSRKNYDR